MVKQNILLVVFIFTVIHVRAQVYQFQPVEFSSNSPKWLRYVEDSTAVGYYCNNCSDYISQFTYVNSILNEGYLYCLYYSHLQNPYIDGTYIEKRDVNTGKVLWSNIFDLRKNDYAEKPKLMFFNDNELEIIGVRSTSKKEEKKDKEGILFKRTIDSETGELVDFWFANADDPGTYVFDHRSDMFRYNEDKYQYLLNKAYGVDKNNIRSIIFDESGKLVEESAFIYNNTYEFMDWHRPFFLLDDSTFISTRLVYEDHDIHQARYDYKYYVEKFTRNLDSLSSIDISGEVNAKGDFDLVLESFDEDYLMFYFKNEYFYNEYDYYYLIFDHSGNMLDSININKDKDFHLGTIKRISDDEMLIIGANTEEVKKDFSLRIYRKKFGQPLMFVREISMKPDYVYLYIRKIEALNNGDFLFFGVQNYFFDLYRTNWPFWMYINGEDLEHGVYVESLGDIGDKNKIKLYPNPAKNILEIESENIQIDHIKVFDISGYMVLDNLFTSGKIQTLDIRTLDKGAYIIRAYDEDEVIANARFVKE